MECLSLTLSLPPEIIKGTMFLTEVFSGRSPPGGMIHSPLPESVVMPLMGNQLIHVSL